MKYNRTNKIFTFAILCILSLLIICSIIVIFLKLYKKNDSDKPLFVKLDTQSEIQLDPIIIDGETYSFKQLLNSKDTLDQTLPFKPDFTYSIDQEGNAIIHSQPQSNKENNSHYNTLIETYGNGMEEILNYLCNSTELTPVSLICDSFDTTSQNSQYAYKINGVIHMNNDLTLYIFENQMSDFDLEFINSIDENQISFIYEQRQFHDSTIENRYCYYKKEEIGPYTLLFRFETNYTVLDQDISVVDVDVLNQEDARRLFCNITNSIHNILQAY